jgi:hypothetical protein
MRLTLLLSTCAFGFSLLSAGSSARAETPAAKPPEVRTIQPSQLSTPLSAAQLAKQARLQTVAAPAPAPTEVAGTKPAPFFTALEPDPRLAGAHALANNAKLKGGLLPGDLARSALAGSMQPANATSGAKPADLVTVTPAVPAQAGAHAAALANKLAHASARKATPAGRKPASMQTDGPAPATLSPAQLAKRAQAAADTRRPQ